MTNIFNNNSKTYELFNEASETKDPNILEKLSESPLWVIRNEVAKNIYTNEKTLYKLSQDKESWTIREEVAYNINTPLWVLENMAFTEKQYTVIDMIVNREDATKHLYETITKNPNFYKFHYAKKVINKYLTDNTFIKNEDFYKTRIQYILNKKDKFLQPIMRVMKLVEEYDSEIGGLVKQQKLVEEKYVSQGIDLRNRECQKEKKPIVLKLNRLRSEKRKALLSINGNKWNVWREDERLLQYEEQYDLFRNKPLIYEYKDFKIGNAVSTGYYEVNSPEWHELRTKGIGGSEIGIIMGVNPYKTPEKLFLEKTGQIEQNFIKSSNIIRGNSYEPIIRRQFALDYPEYKVWYSKSSWRNINHTLQLANLDGLYSTNGSDIPDAILEIKSISNPYEWKNNIPEYYRLQLLWYIDTLGFKTGTIRAVVAEYNGLIHNMNHYYDYIVNIDEEEIKYIKEKVFLFQERIEEYKKYTNLK